MPSANISSVLLAVPSPHFQSSKVFLCLGTVAAAAGIKGKEKRDIYKS